MEENIKHVKYLRVKLDGVLQELQTFANLKNGAGRATSLSITKVEEAIMWLGKELNVLGAVNPYPESMNPDNAIVSPTADVCAGTVSN